MKKIEDILSEMNPKSLYEYSPPFAQPKFTEMDYKIVNKLFLTFTSIFPAFKQAWPTESEFEGAKREWMKAFKQVDLTDLELIKIGVGRFRLLATPFVPSPGQFIEMCKQSPEDHGLKSPEMAFREACEQSHPTASKIFSHPTIKLARDLTGSFFMCNSPRSRSFPVFEKHYSQCVRMFLEEKNLNQIEFDNELKKQELKEPEHIDQFRHLTDRQSAVDRMKEMLK